MMRPSGISKILRRGYQLCSAVCVVMVLAGCATESRSPLPDEEWTKVSAVAVVQPEFAIAPGATVAWRTEILWLGADAQGRQRDAFNGLSPQLEIENQLREEGLIFVELAQADYVLVAAVMIGDTVADITGDTIGDTMKGAAQDELARLYPSLALVTQTLDQGELLVGLSRSGSPVVLWHAAVQIDLNDTMTQQQRRARLQSAVRSLMTTLPKSAAVKPD